MPSSHTRIKAYICSRFVSPFGSARRRIKGLNGSYKPCWISYIKKMEFINAAPGLKVFSSENKLKDNNPVRIK
jgi:hypothetical protein